MRLADSARKANFTRPVNESRIGSASSNKRSAKIKKSQHQQENQQGDRRPRCSIQIISSVLHGFLPFLAGVRASRIDLLCEPHLRSGHTLAVTAVADAFVERRLARLAAIMAIEGRRARAIRVRANLVAAYRRHSVRLLLTVRIEFSLNASAMTVPLRDEPGVRLSCN